MTMVVAKMLVYNIHAYNFIYVKILYNVYRLEIK